MDKKNINKKAAILATVLSGWMLGCSNVLAANLMAGVPSDYTNSQLGAITGSNVTTYVDATPAKGVVTDLNRDPAVFNVMVNGESKIFLRQYTYSTTSLKGSILFDSDGEWDSFDNPSGVIEQAPNAHGAAASGDYLYIADYDFGKIAVAKITETGLEEDTTKAIDLKQAIIEHCGAVFESEYAWVHGEGIIAKDGCLFVMVNVNPKGDYYNYVDSYLMQYAVNVDGSLKYVSHTRAGKNTDVVRMNIYNNMILTTAIGGMQNYGGTIADDKDSIVPGEGETIGNRDTCISIGVISGGKLELEKKDVVVPEKVKDRGLDFRDIQILPNGTAYVMTYNLSGSGGGSTMRVYKTTVTNLLSQKPIDWEEIIDKTTIGNEDDKNGSGWFNQIYAEYYTKRVWAEIGDSLVVYTDGAATPKYTWLTKDFSTNEQLYKWNSLITVRPDEVTGDTALLVTYTPEGITSSSETVVRTVNENLQYQPGDYFISITGTDADKAYSSVTKDNSIYTFNSDKVIDLYFGDEGDKVNNVLAAIYANNGNDIIVNSGENDLQLQVENYISSPVGIFSGNGKDVTVNAGGLNILTYGYSGGNSLTNAIWLDPTQAGDGSININSDVNISMTGGYGGNGIAVQKTDRWGEASYTADNEAAIVINGDVAIKGVNSETWGIPINYENVFSRFNNSGILTSVEKSTVTVNGNIDFDVYGNGITTNAKDSVVTINGGGKIAVPSGMNYGYYTLASFLGTINMNTGANGNVPGSKDVQLNGDIFALNTGNINLALTTEASYLDGIVDNGGTVNLWLQNGATWINEANNTRYKQDNEDVGSGEQSRVTNFVGGNSKASAGVIHQTTNSKDLTIDNYRGYTKVLYGHDTSNPTNIYGGNVTIGSASNGSNITLITNYDANMNSTDVQNEVLNALANKLYYIGYTNGENNLTGTVAIAEGLTASSVYQYVGDIAYSSSTGQGRLYGTGKPAPVEPDIPTLDEDNAVVDKSAETWESNTSGENVQVEIKDDSTWKGDSKGDNLTANITNSTWEGNSTGAGLGANITNSTWKGDSTGAGAEVTLQDGGKWHGEHKGHDGKVNVGKDSEWIGSNYGDKAKVEVSEGAWHGENAGQKAEVTLTNGANWTGANTGDEATINVDGGIWEGANTGDDAQINMSGNASWKGNSEGKGAKITLGSKTRMRTFSLRSTGPVWEGDNSGEDTELVIGTGASWIGNNIGGNIKVEGDIDGLWQGDNAGTVTVDGITWNGNNLTNAIATVGSGAWVGNNFGTATFNGGSWTGNNVENGTVTVNATGWDGNNAGAGSVELKADWSGNNTANGSVTLNGGTWSGNNTGESAIVSGTNGKWTGDNRGTITVKGITWEGENLTEGSLTLDGGTWTGANSGIANIEGGKWTGTNAATTNLLAGEWTGVNTGTAIIKGGAWSNDNAGIVTFNGGSWTGNNAVKGKATIEADGWSGNNAGSVTLNDGTWNGSNEGAATIKGGIWTGDNTGEATLENGEWSGDNLTTGIAIIEGGKWSGDNIGKVTLNKGTWEGINKGDANVTEVDWNKDNAGTVEINKGSWNGNNTGTATLTDVEWEGNNKNKVIVNNGSWVGSNESAGEATLSGGEWTGDNSGTVKMNCGTWSGNNEAQGNATIEGGTWKGANAGIAYFNGGKWTGDNTETGKVTVTADGWTGNNTGAGTVIVKGATWGGNNLGTGATLNFNEEANWTGDNTGANATVKLDGASNWNGANTGANLNLTLDGASVWEGYSNVGGFTINLNGNSVWKNTGASKVASFVGNNGVVDMSSANSGNITIDSYSGNVTVLYDHGVSDEAGTQVTVNGGNFTVTSAMDNSAITLVMGRDGLDLTEEDSINAALNALAAKLFYTNYVKEGNLAGTVKIAEGLTASSVSKQTANIVFGGEDGQGSVDKTTINPGPQYPTAQDKDTFTTTITGDAYDSDAQKEYRKHGVIQKDNAATYSFIKDKTTLTTTGSAINTVNDVVINLNGNALEVNASEAAAVKANDNITVNEIGILTVTGGIEVSAGEEVKAILKGESSELKAEVLEGEGTVKVELNKGSWTGDNKGKAEATNGTWNGENNGTVSLSEVTWMGYNTGVANINGGAWSGNNFGNGVSLKDSTWTGYSNAEGLALALNNSTWNNTGASKVQSVTASNGVVNMTNANSGDVTIANYSGSIVVLYNHSIADDATSTMTGGKVVTVNGGNITIGSATTGAEITLRTDRNGLNLESSIYTDKNLVNVTLDALANKLFYTAYTTGETNLKGYVEIAEGLTASSVSKRVEGVSFDEVTGQGGYVYETAYPEEQVKDTFELENALGSAEAEEALKEAGVLKANGKYEFTSDPTELKGNNVVVATEKDVVIDADGTLKLTAEETAIKAIGKDVTISAKNTIVTGQIGVDADDAKVNIDGSVNIEAGKGIAVANGGMVTIDNALITSSIAAINAVGGEVNIAKGNVTGTIHATNGAVVNLGSTVWAGDNIGDNGTITMTKASKWEGNNEGSNTNLTMEYNTWKGNNIGAGADITLSDNASWVGNNTGANVDITLNDKSVWTGYSSADELTLALNNSTWNNTGSSNVQSVTANKGVVNMTNANGDVTVANYSGSMVVLYSHSITDDATSTMTGGKVVTVNGGNITIGNAATGAEIILRTDRNGLTVGSDVYTDKNLVNATLDALANKLFYTAYTTGETNLKGYVEIAEGLTASSARKAFGDVKFDETTGQGGLDGYVTVYPEEQVKDTFELENALGSAEAEEALKEAGVLKADGKYEFTSDPTVLNGENVVVAAGKDVSITAEGALELCAGNIAVGAANNKVDVEAKDLGIKGNVIAIGGGVVDVNATGKLVLDGDIQVDSNSVVTAKFSGADSKFTGNIAQYDGVALLNSEIPEHGVSLEFTNKASWEGWNTSDNFKISLDDSVWYNTDASKAQSITAKKGVVYMDGANAAMDVSEFSGDLTVVYDRDDEGNILGESFVVQKASKINEKTNSSITLFTEKGNIEVKKDNEAEIRNVFEQLADKLQYKEYSVNEGVDEQGNPINNYLDGYVKMAEGITGTGATADIVFGADNTVGNIKIGPEINYGAYETAMMKGAKSAMTSSAMMWRAEANDLMKRMGDLRMAEGEYGIWAKYYGTKQEMEAQNTKYTNSYKAYQLGFDKKVGDWTVGVAASYGDGESTYASGRGENSVVSLGMYGAWNGEDGQYVDVIMKRSKLDNEYELNGDVTIGRLEADYETWATSISAEYGKRIETNKGFYVEPSVEFTLGRVDGASYNTSFSLGGQRLNVQQDDYDTLIGRLGLRLGQKLDKASYYAKFAVAKEFCGDYDTKYATMVASGLTDIKETSMSFKDTWYELQIGGTAQLSDNSYIYASYERNFGADVEQKWRIDAGLRWTF